MIEEKKSLNQQVSKQELSQESAVVLYGMERHHKALFSAFEDLTQDLNGARVRIHVLEAENAKLREENAALQAFKEKASK